MERTKAFKRRDWKSSERLMSVQFTSCVEKVVTNKVNNII